MNTPESGDEFLYRIRVRPRPQFARQLKMKLDHSSSDWEPAMSTHTRTRAPLSHRGFALFAIAGLHAAFIVAFTTVFVSQVTPVELPPPIDVDFPAPNDQPPESPDASDPVFDRFAVSVPTPLPPIPYTPDAPAPTIDSGLAPQFSGMAVDNPSVSYVRAGLAQRFPDPDSFYPASAIRQELEGKALVRVCVGPDGRLVEAPQIAQSTQHRVLDDAALRLARAGRYVAGSRDGVGITDCFNFQAKFQLGGRGQ